MPSDQWFVGIFFLPAKIEKSSWQPIGNRLTQSQTIYGSLILQPR
jgi:hypothetical protein